MRQLHKNEDPQVEPHEFVYIIVRNDLSAPQKAVQACHAVIESTKSFEQSHHPSVIICTVPNEESLTEFFSRLDDSNIRYKAFNEPDIGDEWTAIATEPIHGDKRKAFSNLPLLKGGAIMVP